MWETMSRREFRISYFALAKRYHRDRNPHGAELYGESGDVELLPNSAV
jgi:hypothetical protein